MPMPTEEARMLEEVLQAWASDHEGQVTFQTVGFFPWLLWYDRDSVLVRQAPVYGALQKNVPGELRACKLYLSHYPP